MAKKNKILQTKSDIEKRFALGINKITGRLKKGFKYDSNGKVVAVGVKPKRKTTPELKICAAKLGSKGGKATAKKRAVKKAALKKKK